MDITMCDGILEDKSICPIRDQCLRHVGPQNEYHQSFFINTPGKYIEDKEKNRIFECEYFYKTNKINNERK